MHQLGTRIGFLLFLLILTACGHSEKMDPGPATLVRAPGKVRDSFQLMRPEIKGDRTAIAIAKNSLEKEFLLRSSIVTQIPAPLGTGLKTRVVAFRRYDGKIYMLEASKGHRVSDELPQSLVLAAFPIVDEDSDWITFDFNTGMSHLFVYEDWHASNNTGTHDESENFKSAPVRFSYLDGAKFTDNNSLSIRQVAQLSIPDYGVHRNTAVEVRYLIHPYAPSPDYEPVRAVDSKRMGFFEVAPQFLPDGKQVIFATRFDPKKPILFAISHNTPADFRAAVRDGILYWNKAFGAEVIKVVDAPAGVTAPDHNLNVVQWIPHDLMGFAYADAQMDPRTGEILQAQVFMSSVFAEAGKWRGSRILNQERPHAIPSLRGFHSARLCDRALDRSALTGLAVMREEGADEKAILRAAQDYVSDVIAHEIGHTLGLRHNFAASTQTSFTFEEIPALVKEYLKSGTVPDSVVPFGSVMDYSQFAESIFSGSQMRQTATPAAPYDQAVIDALYLGKTRAPQEMPPFCTDQIADEIYVDCRRGDRGASFLDSVRSENVHLAKNVADNLLDQFYLAKSGLMADPIPVEEVQLPSAEQAAKFFLETHEYSVAAVTGDAKLLKVIRRFSRNDDSTEDLIQRTTREELAKELMRLGGIEQVFAPISDDFTEETLAHLSDLLIRYGATFSADERKHILGAAEAYLPKLAEALVKVDLAILGKQGKAKIEDDELGSAFAELLKSRVEKYVFAVTGATNSVEVTAPAAGDKPERTLEAKLPEFLYEFETRTMAAGLFGKERGDAIDWAFRERVEMQDKFVQMWKDAVNTIPKEVPLSKAPKDVVRWLLENMKVAAALGVDQDALKGKPVTDSSLRGKNP